MAAAAKDAAGKVWTIFFPIFAFVIAGFEHCVANMYYIMAGMFAQNNMRYVEIATEQLHLSMDKLASLNFSGMFINNLIPVTIGNKIGGMLLIGAAMYYLNREKKIK